MTYIFHVLFFMSWSPVYRPLDAQCVTITRQKTSNKAHLQDCMSQLANIKLWYRAKIVDAHSTSDPQVFLK